MASKAKRLKKLAKSAERRIAANTFKNSQTKDAGKVNTGPGLPCPRCARPMARWEHSRSWQLPIFTGFYRYWHECLNDACRTKQVMPKDGYVPPLLADPELADIDAKMKELNDRMREIVKSR